MTDQLNVHCNGATNRDCKSFWPGVPTAGLVGWVLAGLVALAGCQTTADKDAGGVTMQLSEWKEIKLYDVDLNIPLLASVKITKAERQMRDNRAYHDKLTVDHGKGEIFTQRAVASWYKLSSQERIKDKSVFELQMKKFFGADLVGIKEIRKISPGSAKAGGYIGIVNVYGSRGKCLYSRSGYRLGTTPYDNDEGLFDTFMFLHYCDPDVTIEQFSEIFSSLDLVSDRDAMKSTLTSPQ